MDPISFIVTAVALGASAGLTDAAEDAVSSAYARVKKLIVDKIGGGSLGVLEKKPESEDRRSVLADDLKDAGAGDDAELLAQAKALIDAVEQSKAGAAAAAKIGVDLKDVKAAALRVQRVSAADTGVSGDIDISDVQAGVGGTSQEVADPKA